MKKHIWLLTGLLVIEAGCVTAQQSLSTRLDSLLTAKSPRAFSGVVLIVQKGKPIYSREIGYVNSETTSKRPSGNWLCR